MKPLISTIFKRIIISSLLLSSLLFPIKLIAKNVTPENVKKVALNVFSNRSGINKTQIQISEEIPVIDNGEVVYTIFNLTPQGHIVVSNDDIVEPILGYGLESHIDFKNIPPALKYLLGEYETEISAAKNKKLVTSETVKTKWSNYLSDDYAQNLKSYTVGDYLLETNWGQEGVYNDACPSDPVTHNQCVVGCVGVALGQVLNYWGCRVFPDDDVSYTPARFSSPLSVNFYDQNYNWDDIRTVPGATAQFLYHCALAVYSNFGDYDIGTSSTIYMARSALINYFGFNADYPISKSSYTNTQWINLLKGEIDEERPIIYRGECNGCSEGHVWVVDGYDIYDKFHCNWGWAGQYQDVFYSLSNLIPNNEDYTYDQRAILGIEPIIDDCTGLTGEAIICYPDTVEYSVTIPSTASVTWNKTGNLAIVGSSTNPTCSMRSTSNAGALSTITATIKNSQGQTFLTRTRTVWVGVPVINNIVGDQHLPTGGTSSYLATTEGAVSATYQWSVSPSRPITNQGNKKVFITFPSTNGDYVITLIVTNDCGPSTPYYYYVSTGEYEPDIIFPNPTSGETTVSLESVIQSKAPDETAEWELEIYDNAQMLKEKKTKLKGNNTKIQTAGWKEGMYIVRVKYKDQILTGKLVVKK